MKENNFIIDSVNIQKSRLREYNPLMDRDLLSFFECTPANSHLKRIKILNTGIVIKDINNNELASNIPVNSEDALLKYFKDQDDQLYQTNQHLPPIENNTSYSFTNMATTNSYDKANQINKYESNKL